MMAGMQMPAYEGKDHDRMFHRKPESAPSATAHRMRLMKYAMRDAVEHDESRNKAGDCYADACYTASVENRFVHAMKIERHLGGRNA